MGEVPDDPPVAPPASVLAAADRRRSRRWWGLGVQAHAHLTQGLSQMLVVLDRVDAGEPVGAELADLQHTLDQSVGTVTTLLAELLELQRRLLAGCEPGEEE